MVLAGVLISASTRDKFQLKIRPRRSWINQFIGGLLMGLGAALIPGGNDVLLLNGIPGLSPHAAPAFLSMLLGIAITLLVKNARK